MIEAFGSVAFPSGASFSSSKSGSFASFSSNFVTFLRILRHDHEARKVRAVLAQALPVEQAAIGPETHTIEIALAIRNSPD